MPWYKKHKRHIAGILAYAILGLQMLAPEMGDPELILTAIKWMTYVGTLIFGAGWMHAWAKKKP